MDTLSIICSHLKYTCFGSRSYGLGLRVPSSKFRSDLIGKWGEFLSLLTLEPEVQCCRSVPGLFPLCEENLIFAICIIRVKLYSSERYEVQTSIKCMS